MVDEGYVRFAKKMVVASVVALLAGVAAVGHALNLGVWILHPIQVFAGVVNFPYSPCAQGNIYK